MAHKFETIEFHVIEGKATDFLSIGMGASDEVYTIDDFVSSDPIMGGLFKGSEIIVIPGGAYLVCDDCNNEIGNDDTCYYVAVLNRVFCKKCFDRWIKGAQYYLEDQPIELKNYRRVKVELEREGLWDNND